MKSYLEIEIKTLAQVDLFGEAFVFAHVEGQRIVAIRVLAFREEDSIVEANKLTTRHPLHMIKQKSKIKKMSRIVFGRITTHYVILSIFFCLLLLGSCLV